MLALLCVVPNPVAWAQSSLPMAAPATATEASELNLLLLEVRLDDSLLADSLTAYEVGNDILLPLGEMARLLTIGITEPLCAAPAASSIPPIYGFTATPVYAAPGAARNLTDIALSTAAPLPPNFLPVLRASAALSQTRAYIRPSNLRVIQAGVTWASQPYSALALWQQVYGTTPPGGTITFELSLVDPVSGLVGAAVRAATTYNYTPTPPPIPGTLTVEVEGQTIAVIPDSYVEIEGDVVAN